MRWDRIVLLLSSLRRWSFVIVRIGESYRFNRVHLVIVGTRSIR